MAEPAAFLGVDLGTTHCKAGLFSAGGDVIRLHSQPVRVERAASGYAFIDPEALWETARSVVEAAVQDQPYRVAAIGIASMAETGLLIDRMSGVNRSVLLPWFDTSANLQAEVLSRRDDPVERFCKSGIRPSFKCSLSKLLWLQDQDAGVGAESVWLSTADYIAFRLTGQMATDYSLAGRTYAFDLDSKDWDANWLGRFGLGPHNFPPAYPAGAPAGETVVHLAGLSRGTPVVITGHDHVCAAFGAGVVRPGQVFNSIGTAESFIGVIDERRLGVQEHHSGLSYGYHVVPERMYWMGGLSASGGSVEWLRKVIGEQPLSYAEMESLAEQAGSDPTGILYFPYLAGSGSPHSDPLVRGAFIGLNADHTRQDIAKAVLEGTAYEMEFIRRTAEQVSGRAIEQIRVAGGGVRNRTWMQIKADISGCVLDLLEMPEVTLLGAALLAGVRAGYYRDVAEALAAAGRHEVITLQPDVRRNRLYRDLYEQGFLPMQEPLRAFGRWAGWNL